MEIIIRPYTSDDRKAVRHIYGIDEFCRPKLLEKYPKLAEFMADDMSYYPDYEPESLFVAQVDGRVVGALLGAVDTGRFEQIYHHHIRPTIWRRVLTGSYGWPGWIPAYWLTDWAENHRKLKPVQVDRCQYPAHLHIGVLPGYRRLGLGTRLMECYAEYLRSRCINGYHLFASSFHYLGVSFYKKLGLEVLGQFDWQLHTGYEWVNVTETIFGRRINGST